MLNIITIIKILSSLLLIIVKNILKIKYLFSTTRKLEDISTYSEIKVTVDLDRNDEYINKDFYPQPNVEQGENNIKILKWNEKILDCSYMFLNASIITIDLSKFDTSEVTSMEYMFKNCKNLTNFNLNNNNLSNLKTMEGIFYNCNNLISITFENIDFNELTSLNEIFTDTNITYIDFINLNFNKLNSFKNTFSNISSLSTIKLINVTASELISMEEMFSNCNNLINATFINFEANNATTLEKMFDNCKSLSDIKLDGVLENINTSNVVTMENMFYNCRKIKNFSLENITFLELTNMKNLFNQTSFENIIFKNLFFPKLTMISPLINQPIYSSYLNVNFENINMPNAITFEELFYIYNLENAIFKNITIPNVTSFLQMFSFCSILSNKNITFENIYAPNVGTIKFMIYNKCVNAKFENLNFKNINFSKLESMNNAISVAYTKNLNLENIDVPNVKTIDSFYDSFGDDPNNTYFKNINFPRVLSIKNMIPFNKLDNIIFINVNMSEVRTMEYMFNLSKFSNFTFENVDISKVTSMKNMIFNNRNIGKISLKNLNALNVEDIDGMFKEIYLKNISLENIDFSKLISMKNMFNNIFPSLISIKNINAPNLQSMEEMFKNIICTNNIIQLENIKVENLQTMKNMFECQGSGINISFNDFYSPNLKSTEYMFKECPINSLRLDGILENINISKLESMKGMFMYSRNLKNFAIENITFTELTNMDNMFCRCYFFENITFKNLNFYKSFSMIESIYSLTSLININFQNINFFGPVSTNSLINSCSKLQNATFENLCFYNSFNFSNLLYGYNTLSSISFKYLIFYDYVSINNLISSCYLLQNITFENLTFHKSVTINKLIRNHYSLYNINFININLVDSFKIIDIAENIPNNLINLTFEDINASQAIKIENICNKTYIRDIYFKNINISKVESLEEVFNNCENLRSIYLENIDISQITKIENIFYSSNQLENISLININIPKVVSLKGLFRDKYCIKNIIFKNIVSDSLIDISKMFYNTTPINSLDMTGIDISRIKNMESLYQFYKGDFLNLSYLNTSSVINMNNFFSDSYYLKSLDISNFNTLNVETMDYMFSNVTKIEILNLSNFNTPKLKSVKNMFSGCVSLKSLNLGHFDGSLITNMISFFSGCYNLESVDLSNILSDRIEYMNEMFYNCSSLKYLNLSNFNTKNVKNFSRIFYECNNLENIEIYNFYTVSAYGSAFEKMFCNCYNLKQIDLSYFDTSFVTSMNQMFYNCYNLSEINVEKFNTSAVIDMQKIFSGCKTIKSLDLSHFDTSNVITMEQMFSNCENLEYINYKNINTKSLLNMSGMFKNCNNLNYINFLNLEINHNISISDIVYNINKNIIYCINDVIKAYIIKNEFDKIENANNNCTILCSFEDKTYISDIGKCSIDCRNEEINKYLYDDKCVFECPFNTAYLYVIYNLCSENCLSYDFFLKKCKMYRNNLDIREEFIKQLENDIIKGLLNEMILPTIYEKNEDFVIQEEDISYQLLSTNTKNNYNNISSLDLQECENKLKVYYNISDNKSLLIFKIDYNVPDLLIPIVEYKVFHPETNQPLDLEICNDTYIAISYPILQNIENDGFIHDPKDKFYNHKCYPYSENGTDIILNDRKKIYNDKYLGLCEKNCEFIGYDNETKKSHCNCEVKTIFKEFSNITKEKNKLLNNFIDFNSTMNLDVIFCYKSLFCIDGIKYNIGNYIILFIIIISIVNAILFPNIEYKTIFSIINDMINSKKNEDFKNKNINHANTIEKYENIENKEKDKKNNKLNLNKINKRNKKNIKFEKYDSNKINLNLTDNNVNSKIKIINKSSQKRMNFLSENNNKLENKSKIKSKYNNNENNDYTDNEINQLKFKEAINIDKRTYLQYYISLIKTKHILILSFYTKNDNNSRIIKITIFFFSFALLYAINSLFFQDSTMHKIYEDYGVFNFIYQLPKIIYSTIISAIINLIVKKLSLTENTLSEIKKSKNLIKINDIMKCLKIKFVLFFVLVFLILDLFWYYLSCFCAVYKDSQIHLLKDTLISFGCSLIYPFGLNLLPGIFRVPALKKRNSCGYILYNISKIIQLI